MSFRPILSFTALALTTSPLLAQAGGAWIPHHEVRGSSYGGEFGTSVAFIGDINADGVSDYVVGAPWTESASLGANGIISVRDGATGNELRQHSGTSYGGRLGIAVEGLGDINGDGIGDYCASEPWADLSRENVGGVYAWSGADGSPLWTAEGFQAFGEFGISCVRVPDATGDGVDDVLINSPSWIPRGSLWLFVGRADLFSGADGSLVHSYRGSMDWEGVGYTMGPLGDVNGDGVQDIGISRRGPDHDTPGYLVVVSSDNFNHIGTLEGPAVQLFNPSGFAAAFCSMGDLDGDGADEFAISMPYADNDIWHNTGRVEVIRGRTMEVLWSVDTVDQYSDFGASLISPGDIDGDGLNDLIVGQPGSWPGGSIQLFSGRDGRNLARLDSETYGAEFGRQIDAGADLNGDGVIEMLVGAIEDGVWNTYEGSVLATSWSPLYFPEATQASNSAGGQIDAELRFPQSEAQMDYALLLSAAGPGISNMGGVQVPLVRDRLFRLALQGALPSSFVNAQGTLDAAGQATISFQWAPDRFAGDAGVTYWAAVVSYDLNGVRMSSAALPLRITP